VAIKVIELRSLKDDTSKTMLNTEIECFREVQHPNVLRYCNSFFTANNCYIVTEYCPGSDLSKLMKTKGKIPEQEAAQLFLQIFQGYKAFY
jgi:serine/threonine protein kinase